MKRRLFFILMFSSVLLQAQVKQGNSKLESLLRELSKAKDDTGKVALLYNIAINYLETNTNDANKYASMGLDLAEKLNWEKGIVLTANLLGDNYAGIPDYPKALEYYSRELEVCERSGYRQRIAATLSRISDVYDMQGNYVKAIETQNKALKFTEDLSDKRGQGRSLGALGKIYLNIAKHPSAQSKLVQEDKKQNLGRSIDYSNRSVRVAEEIGDIDQLKMSYKNLSAAQKMSGNVKDALASYGKLMSLKHSILNPKKAKEAERKKLEYEYGRREDSMRAQKQVVEENLKQQTQIATQEAQVVTQQQRQLQATNKALSATAKQEEKARLNLQKTQEDLTIEKDNAEEKEKQLTLAEEQKALQGIRLQLQKDQLQMKDRALEMRRKEQYFYIIGIVGLLAFSLVLYRGFTIQKRYNLALIREKKRSEGLLLNILPFEVAEELMDKGSADAKHFDNVTVLFTDFISFTYAAETMTPKQLVDELHICFKAFDEILGKYHIEKIKTVGDAYIAVSGLPRPNPNHAGDVAEAAMEIRDYMLQRKRQMGNNTFSVRLGINSGSVVAGIVGVTKFAYDIWGDAVNIAARMEQTSEDGKINISETTYALIKDKYECLYRGKVEAKNKGSIDMYYLMAKHLSFPQPATLLGGPDSSVIKNFE